MPQPALLIGTEVALLRRELIIIESVARRHELLVSHLRTRWLLPVLIAHALAQRHFALIPILVSLLAVGLPLHLHQLANFCRVIARAPLLRVERSAIVIDIVRLV